MIQFRIKTNSEPRSQKRLDIERANWLNFFKAERILRSREETRKMKPKKYKVKVLIGNKVIRSEQVNEDLISEYISSFKKFYKDGARFEVAGPF